MISKIKTPSDLEVLRQAILSRQDPNKQVLRVCCTTACRAGGALDIVKNFKEELAERGLQDKVEVKKTGCRGFCEKGPVMVIEPEEIFYSEVKPKDVTKIIDYTLLDGRPVKRLLYTDAETRKKITNEKDIPFFGKQVRRVFSKTGKIDPTQIQDYIAEGGYRALAKALTTMEPEEIIEAVEASGLRGRGGGGFPTGRKWRACWEAPGSARYVIANGDEGDPGAFMDRSLMEGDPHSIVEGMIIGAYAIGANEGFIYVRDEYPIAVEHLSIAVEQATSLGLLGKDILGAGFDFTIEIERGAGAFVCGESTALMNSLEGRVGEPRAKYVHTVASGLWDRPSALNNVETWANVPLIIDRGAEWYASTGTANSKGTKIFSLVGKVQNTGLIEVPMGITLREIIFDIGGGIRKGGKLFKAVQTGGPSGGCIPEHKMDMPVDYDSLKSLGAIMGSGGMIVMDENTCMVDTAKYFVNFLMSESCGKCVPCREGLEQMHEILTNICEGNGEAEDIALLERLSSLMMDTSLCALGGTAPNPVLSTIRYFRDEYEAHIFDKECPAGVCRNPGIIRVTEFGCESPLRFYEYCFACPQFKDGCPDLSLSRTMLEGKRKLVFSDKLDSEDTVNAKEFHCLKPLSYFEKSRNTCGRQGKCREEGLLVDLLSGKKELVHSGTRLKKS
ncbi:MAG: NAD(P)H-dependent oxidoreductase subunit E [Deltaproteobacteria bacterium]|jgi:NADH-quinone oxidoreductase subunit F|nr:NAD(P)H-dependent oxidoreductase subunit E [Deltaproteobacteria bacterium]MBW2318115.1 NAD(P)H-dependent oxidoreductase subunit E [Deltaproteobacteria bacterium]OEU45880.1 MAG: NADH dehydrogenase [Desulfobacterales bacterium S7086C20]